MEERPPWKTLLFVCLAILLPFFAINVESQQPQNGQQRNVSPILPRLQPPPLLPQPILKPPPLLSQPILKPPLPPLPLRPHVPRVPIPLPTRPPPPPYGLNSAPKSTSEFNPKSQLAQHRTHKKKRGLKFNSGQKIGLLFAGIVIILQIEVVGFLAFKRRQLLRMRD